MFGPEQVEQILKQGEEAARKIASALRGNSRVGKRCTKMHIAVVSRDGSLIKMHSMDDAWEGSKDIAIAKARTAAFFSSNENALTSRVIGTYINECLAMVGEGVDPSWLGTRVASCGSVACGLGKKIRTAQLSMMAAAMPATCVP